jgi:hypothetical protein
MVGLAKGNNLYLSDWSGIVCFTVVLDDFEVVLGKEFMRLAYVAPVPLLDQLLFFYETKIHVIPTVRIQLIMVAKMTAMSMIATTHCEAK